ncbi:hemerythrin domain-containing protein [Agilicoccus flavus]|uniref:hemerythrin domain-containing protein n=1 Tax=Agilicoccus flavus TaxID=2775968 RepID=UPI001CF647AE|nr:hemerythrin domain-containing protein [Agilicoccus flavus]
MCQYCGCQEIGPIGDLMAEHVVIQNLCGETERCVDAGDARGAYGFVAELARVMVVHNTVEERGLYLSMTRFPEFEDQAGVLYDEHDDVDAVIEGVLAAGVEGADGVDWAPVLAAFSVLREHIIHEDNGLFPAAAVALDPADWERCERLRAEATAAPA